MATHEQAGAYAGDKTPQEAWDMLANLPRSMLVDVRTQAEWTFVGIPDLESIGKRVCLVAWQEFPHMYLNAGFVQTVADHIPALDTPVLLLCRSGQRSRSAARALSAEGYTGCYNVLQGFEGDKCPASHRGTTGGWKAVNLPWRQE